ncbi:MAG: ABC transporter ATP-binding protein [Devosia nanyangense]|nr:ABC transporter [Devosia sp. 17-2-E-8]MBI4046097.1 ABC transporter ATP-binding protein [Devosia nanyangense]QMV01603.1 ATP-binding cassette domain-containing protein [Devosia sp. D6-9]CDP53928.1 ABC-type Fe3+-siderophore transport system, ATPase component [Devosia sp. DBB001]
MVDRVSVDNLTVAYGSHSAVNGVTLSVPKGKVTVLAGPNGCGKSTLLRAVRRLHAAQSGKVLLGDVDISRLKEKELAREIGLLAQSPSAPEDMRVEELVRLGRYPHQSMMQPWSPEDGDAVENAMFGTGVAQLRDRRLGSLSGGQLQRVWIAMVLAQETDVICLDEPVNHLDMAHQIDCLDLVSRLNRERGRTVVLVLHDLNLAARYADRLVFLKEGKVVKAGDPAELMEEKLIGEVFGIQCRVIEDPVHNRPMCIPMRNTSPRFAVEA